MTTAFMRLSARSSASSAVSSAGLSMIGGDMGGVDQQRLLRAGQRYDQPAPTRNAPMAARRAAPVCSGPPETTTQWPR